MQFFTSPASAGDFSPDDLNLMQRVFDSVCGRASIGRDQAERRAAIANDILALFHGGARDEPALLEAMALRTAG